LTSWQRLGEFLSNNRYHPARQQAKIKGVQNDKQLDET
jgi:hypothetical protein